MRAIQEDVDRAREKRLLREKGKRRICLVLSAVSVPFRSYLSLSEKCFPKGTTLCCVNKQSWRRRKKRNRGSGRPERGRLVNGRRRRRRRGGGKSTTLRWQRRLHRNNRRRRTRRGKKRMDKLPVSFIIIIIIIILKHLRFQSTEEHCIHQI